MESADGDKAGEKDDRERSVIKNAVTARRGVLMSSAPLIAVR